ncbi:MAG: flagellar hook-basal body complex protein FliE [Woeseiaceae bacterium]|nr:flagellar hook-basal body complex protein FliE [Woeseiaceae bacterium]
MNEISPDQLLSQIRALSKNLQMPSISPAETIGKPESRPEFSRLLKSSLDAVNEAQQTSSELKTAFENGTTDASLAEVMIASQKANLSFRAVTEVRNKLVQAYQDIMNMPV